MGLAGVVELAELGSGVAGCAFVEGEVIELVRDEVDWRSPVLL